MKKIALILALVMVFACALVACDNTEETNSTPANESSVVENNSEEIENTESSAPEEDSVPEESDEAPAATIEGENVAAGKSYTTSVLYRQGGAEVEWKYDENAPIAYPDTDDKELTDGILAEAVSESGEHYTAPEWVGLHGQSPDYDTNGGFAYVTVDLGAKTDIKGVKVYVGCGVIGGGIGSPSSVEIMVSDDGENWTSVAATFPTNPADTNIECVEIPCTANGQYVQVRFTSGGWIFVSEVEIFA